jgi:hypothetical protein
VLEFVELNALLARLTLEAFGCATW